jgi:hypothetical protein
VCSGGKVHTEQEKFKMVTQDVLLNICPCANLNGVFQNGYGTFIGVQKLPYMVKIMQYEIRKVLH